MSLTWCEGPARACVLRTMVLCVFNINPARRLSTYTAPTLNQTAAISIKRVLLSSLGQSRLVHGNTLTAAVVVENVKTAVASSTGPSDGHSDSWASGSNPPCVFLTGATSKVLLHYLRL